MSLVWEMSLKRRVVPKWNTSSSCSIDTVSRPLLIHLRLSYIIKTSDSLSHGDLKCIAPSCFYDYHIWKCDSLEGRELDGLMHTERMIQ